MANDSIDLAEVLAMLLPPGLVFEDPAAYAKIADLPVVPWEDIHKLWNSMGATTQLLIMSRYQRSANPDLQIPLQGTRSSRIRPHVASSTSGGTSGQVTGET